MKRQPVHVFLTNRVATLHKPYPTEDLLPYWSYSVPGFHYMKKRWPGWGGRKKLLKRDRLPSGLFLATRELIETETNTKFIVNFKRQLPQERPLEYHKTSDRWYQNKCVDAMVAAGRCGGLVISATASGKTRVAGMYGSRVEGPLLFVVDQLDLLWQARDEIQDFLHEKVGFVGDMKFKPRRFTIATVQTMHRHRGDSKFQLWTDEIQVNLIDEIHTQLNRRNFDVVADIQPRACFGLTATLQLKKKDVRLRAWSLCGPTIFEFPVKQGMEEQVLSRGIVVRVKVRNEI